jgi:hypothetical protein
MKAYRIFTNGTTSLGCPSALAGLVSGCSSTKPKEPATHQRGWIGGEYKVVRVFPAGLKPSQESALLVTHLNTNTPAALGGLAEGDLILELNQQPATKLNNFRRTIDGTEPGKSVAIKAWRNGQTVESKVRVGRETFTNNGTLALGLPGYFHELRLWPTAGFSLGVLGYEPEPVADRKELSSAEERYFMNCNPKSYQVSDEGWKVWVVVMQAWTHKTIRSQEVTAPQTATALKTAENKDLSYVSQ